jgi:hypothetical protein
MPEKPLRIPFEYKSKYAGKRKRNFAACNQTAKFQQAERVYLDRLPSD